MRVTLIILWIFVLILPTALVRYLHMKRVHRYMIRLFFRGCVRIMSIKIKPHNRPRRPKSTLFVSNHCSYLDIITLGAAMPLNFTPKLDIKYWPIIGPLTSLSGAIYLHRSAPLKSVEQQQTLQDHLFDGANISLFAEGTTNNGREVLPFKTALFRAARRLDEEDPEIKVTPLTIKYTRLNGKEVLTQEDMDNFAWYGDMDLAPHLWNFLRQRKSEMHLYFHETVTFGKFGSRKELAKYCYDEISASFS